MITLRLMLFLALALGLSSAAVAQGTQCRTDPIGSKSSNCASEQFVTDSIAGAVPPQGIANSIFINPTNAPATMQNIAVPACPNDGVHALVYVNGSGLQCVAISIITTVGGVLSGTLPNPLYKGFAAAGIASLNLSALSTFETCGYATCGDGGQAWYVKTGSNGNCAITDSSTQVWFLDPTKPINVLACGAKGDNSTNDQAAIQAAITYAENCSTYTYGPRCTVYAPPGLIFKITSGIQIASKIINLDFQSELSCAFATNSSCFTVAASTPSGYFSLCNIFISSIQQTVSQNTTIATTWNSVGLNGVQINFSTYCNYKFDNIQGFTNRGIYLDGLGDVYSPQNVSHNKFQLGQVVYNGIGIHLNSLNSNVSTAQANEFKIKNTNGNLINIQTDDATHTTSNSNSFQIDAMDNSGLNANGGHGVLNYGSYNLYNFTYRGGTVTDDDIFQAGTSDYNQFLQQNPLTTSAGFNNGSSGTHNKCYVSGVYATSVC